MEEQLNVLIPTIMVCTAVLVGIIALGVSKRSRMREQALARDLAARLGLELVDAETALRRNYEQAGQGALLEKIDKLPAPILRFLVANAPWRLEGERGGVRVAVFSETRSSGKSTTTYTVVRAYYRASLGYELFVVREGAFFKLGKVLFGLKDVELGDPELDPLLRVKAGDPLAAKLLLGGEARDAIAAAATAYKEFRATGAYVHWERRGLPAAAEIEAVLDALVPIARALGG